MKPEFLLVERLGSFWVIFAVVLVFGIIFWVTIILYKRAKKREAKEATEKSRETIHPSAHHEHLPHYSK